ncbi:MAG: GGDEF domain-containing protein [Colwellia sp.]|nr:GGDEF domain-containing protein [Colwellia sp.]MCW8864534.1 GGDEF domain-containing protein [Colwellia sp.]MCW9082230.1 GGDEF domain-containing protein [Colwellia sp.]
MIKQLTYLGTEHQPFNIANKVKMTNIVALFSMLVAMLYTLNYIFILDEPLVAFINALFVLAYSATLLFNKYNAHKASKVYFFSILMLHLVVCTNVYVTNKTGFHLYFFLVPTGAFLLFELKDKFEKVALSLVAIALFFYCENTMNLSPLIELTDEMNHLIYQSVFFINMLEVIFVLTLFANEIEVNEQKLTKQATTDSLTGTYNRHYFFEQANFNLAMANKHKRPFSIILLDFDDFKKINDSRGHHIGDLSLIEAAKQITSHCRAQDCFARIGGDEFVIALYDATLQEAKSIAERMITSIVQHTIRTADTSPFQCKVSIGVSSKSNEDEQLKELMICADKALYRAKEQGGNRVVLFNYS